MIDPLDAPTEVTASTVSSGRRCDDETRWLHGRWLVRLGVAVGGVAALSAPASAHGGIEPGSGSVAFAVVIGLPVVAGLLGGIVAVRRQRMTHRIEGRQRGRFVLGFLLVVLGATFAFAAITASPPGAVAGGTVGVISAAWMARHGTTTERGRPGHAHLTLGAVGTHRLVEGGVLGALYSTGAVIGVVGAATIAGHTALETAAVGGLYASHRIRAGGAVVLLQTSYAVGAVAGLAIAGTIPAPVRVGVLALAGGVLLVTGVTRCSPAGPTEGIICF